MASALMYAMCQSASEMLVSTLPYFLLIQGNHPSALNIAKFKLHQCILMVFSPHLMLAKISCYACTSFSYYLYSSQVSGVSTTPSISSTLLTASVGTEKAPSF